MGLLPHLQALIAMLLPCLADPEPMVRVIACWSLSRYSHWYLLPDQQAQQHTAAQQQQLDAVLGAVLACMLDRNRAVQESACSALANIADDAGETAAAAARRTAAAAAAAPLAVSRR
jgi:transportin-1